MILSEVSAEIRAKAAKLRVEMHRIADLSTFDGLAHPVSMLLAVAFIDAVNDEWDAQMAAAPPGARPIYERAIELAKKQQNLVPGDGDHRFITSLAPSQPPCVAVIKGRDWLGLKPEHPVLALQYSFVGAQPIWARYLYEASLQLAEEAAAEAE